MAYRSSDSSNNSTCTKPAGVVSGDYLIAGVLSDGACTPASGWTQLGATQTHVDGYTFQVFRKVAGSSEPATYEFPSTLGGASVNVNILAYSGADAAAPVVSFFMSTANSATQTVPSVIPAQANSTLVVFVGGTGGAYTRTPPAGMAERQDVTDTWLSLESADLLLTTTAATGTKTATCSTSSSYISAAVAIAPATPPTAPGSFTATATSTSQINLAWTASTDDVGVDHYEISRGGTVIVPSTTSLSYSDTALASSTPYSYSIVAVDAAGNRSAAATASATTLSALFSKLFVGSTQVSKLFVGSAPVSRVYLGSTLVYQLGGAAPAPLRTFYVDAAAGNDSNNGTSTGTAWQTIGKVNATTFQPGDAVYFRRGQTWTGNVVLLGSGTSANPITVGAFGTGAVPVFDANNSGHAFRVNGAWVTVQDIKVQNAGSMPNEGGNGLIYFGVDGQAQRVEATNNYVGITAADGAHRVKIAQCNLHDNTKLFIGPGSTDDAYCNGVGLWAADSCEVSFCTFSGHVATSPDFGGDGAGIEVYGATNALIHHNTSSDNRTFCELGRAGTANNTLFGNLITSAQNSRSALTIQGPAGEGPATGTRFVNNTVVLTGATGCQGFWVGTGTDLYLHNNIFVVGHIGEADSQLNEGHNVVVGDATGIPALATTSKKLASLAAVGFVGANDFHLATGSPALNMGTSVTFTTDLDGNPRVFGSAPDAGCYERQSA